MIRVLGWFVKISDGRKIQRHLASSARCSVGRRGIVLMFRQRGGHTRTWHYRCLFEQTPVSCCFGFLAVTPQ